MKRISVSDLGGIVCLPLPCFLRFPGPNQLLLPRQLLQVLLVP
jgi:hypothetical protein